MKSAGTLMRFAIAQGGSAAGGEPLTRSGPADEGRSRIGERRCESEAAESFPVRFELQRADSMLG